MSRSTEQIEAQIEELRAEAEQLLERDEYDTASEVRVGEITGRLEQLEQRRAQLVELERRVASGSGIALEGGTDQGPPSFIRGGDPWESDDLKPQHRAMRVLERVALSDESRDKIAPLIEGDDGDAVSAWAVAASNPAYERAFAKILRHTPERAQFALESDEQHALQTVNRASMAIGSSSTGGFMLPFLLDPAVILTNDSTINPLRAIANVKTVSANVWHGVSSAGVTAEWISEASEATDSSPTLAGPTVTCFKGGAWVQASFEFVEDSNIAAELGPLFRDSVDRLQAAAMATGNGTSAPHGIVSVLQSVTASRVSAATNGSFLIDDVYSLLEALPPRYRPRASWIGSLAYLNRLRRFGEGSTGANAAFLTDLSGDVPPRLLGKPMFEFSEMTSTLSSATASSDDCLVVGDFSSYIVADRIGSTIDYVPVVMGPNHRPTGQRGWYLHFRVGADDVSGGAAYRMLRL